MWITTNQGANKEWTKVSDNLPLRWVSCVVTDPFDENTAYVAFSGVRYKDYVPHVFRTTDLGQTWEDISSNLPEVPVNDIIVEPNKAGRLYVGTDVGVYYTDSLGASWSYLGTTMPNSPITDLVLHNPTRTLIAATYGRSMYSIDLTGVTENENVKFALENFVLYQNYPNPFNPTTTFAFELPVETHVRLAVYNQTGQLVRTLVESTVQAGHHTIVWDAKDEFGHKVPTGIYIYRMTAGDFSETKKLTLLK